MAPTPAPPPQPQPAGVNPFASVPNYGIPPQEPPAPVYAQPPPAAPISQPIAIPQAGQNLGIYDQTPYCKLYEIKEETIIHFF